MQIVNDLDPLRNALEPLRTNGTIALVPTMGALHEGHLTLVREARRLADAVVVSIFVNPLQFGANEDLDAYPRVLDRDARLLEAEGVAVLWAPHVGAMYPAGFSSSIHVSGVSEGLCGASRPGHFDGVATVVCKLFNQVSPDIAFFGEKDWQQLAVIRRMASDLNLTRPLATQIFGVPIVRESDGLAMSSRNAYLSEHDRTNAAGLPKAMKAAIVRIENGEPLTPVLEALENQILNAGFASIDYAQLSDAQTMEALSAPSDAPMRLLVAARIGTTRLIDNMAVRPPKP